MRSPTALVVHLRLPCQSTAEFYAQYAKQLGGPFFVAQDVGGDEEIPVTVKISIPAMGLNLYGDAVARPATRSGRRGIVVHDLGSLESDGVKLPLVPAGEGGDEDPFDDGATVASTLSEELAAQLRRSLTLRVSPSVVRRETLAARNADAEGGSPEVEDVSDLLDSSEPGEGVASQPAGPEAGVDGDGGESDRGGAATSDAAGSDEAAVGLEAAAVAGDANDAGPVEEPAVGAEEAPAAAGSIGAEGVVTAPAGAAVGPGEEMASTASELTAGDDPAGDEAAAADPGEAEPVAADEPGADELNAADPVAAGAPGADAPGADEGEPAVLAASGEEDGEPAAAAEPDPDAVAASVSGLEVAQQTGWGAKLVPALLLIGAAIAAVYVWYWM